MTIDNSFKITNTLERDEDILVTVTQERDWVVTVSTVNADRSAWSFVSGPDDSRDDVIHFLDEVGYDLEVSSGGA